LTQKKTEKMARPDSPLDQQSWEELCARCGRCCYEKLDFRGKVYYTQLPCKHLDLDTRLCRVYPDRVARQPGCVSLTPELLGKGILPGDCPYVAGLADYPAPFLEEPPDEDESS